MSKAKEHNLTDSFEINGRWSTSGENVEDAGVPGVLKYSPNKTVLVLQGILDDYELSDYSAISKKITIVGFSDKGEYFSLFDCVLSNASSSIPGFDTCSFIVGRFYAGDFLLIDENKLDDVELRFSFLNLDAWLRYNVISHKIYNDAPKAEFSIDCTSENVDKRSFNLSTTGVVLNEDVFFRFQLPPTDYYENETLRITINRFYHMSPTQKNAESPLGLLKTIHSIRRLLVLLVGAPMYFSFIEFAVPEIVDLESERKLKINRITRLFFTQVGDIKEVKRINPWKPRDILVRREDILDNLERIMNTWLDNGEKYINIFAGFISDQYLSGYVETSFLNCTKGLEAYHRVFFPKEVVLQNETADTDTKLEDERQIILNYISQNISPENQAYFEERVTYEDEKSFRKRLNELLRALPNGLMKKIFGNNSNKMKGMFITQVVETRNYYTHRDTLSNYKNAVTDISSLGKMTRQLSGVLRYYSLVGLGIDSSLAEQRLVSWLPEYLE